MHITACRVQARFVYVPCVYSVCCLLYVGRWSFTDERVLLQVLLIVLLEEFWVCWL